MIQETEDKDYILIKHILKDIRRDYNNSFLSLVSEGQRVIVPISECMISVSTTVLSNKVIDKRIITRIVKGKLYVHEKTIYSTTHLNIENININYFVIINFTLPEVIYDALVLYKGENIICSVNPARHKNINRYHVSLNAYREFKRKVYF